MPEFRVFTQNDAASIEALFTSVFTESESEQEGILVGKLAKDMMSGTESGDLYGFVADDEGLIVGSIFFSRLIYQTDLDVFILSPVAIHTDHQGKGLGQSLIEHGLRAIKQKGVQFVTTYGDPAFYRKVGFEPISAQAIEPPYPLSQPQGWLGQSLSDARIDTLPGHCTCVKALANPGYW